MSEKGNAYMILWRNRKETDHVKILDFEDRVILEEL
jgi:hypothetical protein